MAQWTSNLKQMNDIAGCSEGAVDPVDDNENMSGE